MEKFTWDQLHEAISKLSPEQRAKQVYISLDDDSVFKKVEGLETIEEDVYVNKFDYEDCGNLKDLKDAHGEDFNEEDYKLSTPAGTPFLWDGF